MSLAHTWANRAIVIETVHERAPLRVHCDPGRGFGDAPLDFIGNVGYGLHGFSQILAPIF